MRSGLFALLCLCASVNLPTSEFEWNGSVWEQPHARTVLNTGTANDKLVIDTSDDKFRLSYTFGTISRVRDEQSKTRITKTEMITYSNIPGGKNEDRIEFVLPETNVRYRLRLVSSNDGYQLKGTRELTKNEQLSHMGGGQTKFKDVTFFHRTKPSSKRGMR